MPARSRRQQRFLYATKGKAWVKEHHFDKVRAGGATSKARKKAKKRK